MYSPHRHAMSYIQPSFHDPAKNAGVLLTINVEKKVHEGEGIMVGRKLFQGSVTPSNPHQILLEQFPWSRYPR